MLLQAALNGGRTRADHEAVPLTPQEVRDDVLACAAAGAHAFHVHPRGADGAEHLEAEVVDPAADAVHDAVRWPITVSTGAWIEGDLRRRQALVQRWCGPDGASVNVDEEGAFDLMRTLLGQGTTVEAGVTSVEDAEALVASGLGDRVERVLIELPEMAEAEVPRRADAILAVLDRARLLPPRLLHAEGAAAWPALEEAVRRGLDTRIGLEDVLVLPDGSPASGNAALVAAAVALGAGA